MQDRQEPRKFGNWEVTNAMHIGNSEVVFGENTEATAEPRYACAYCKSNSLIRQYSDCAGGNDYLEIMELFLDRLKEQIALVRDERASVTVPTELISSEQCETRNGDKSIEGRIVAMNADVLRPEYRGADSQLLLVEGGFGAQANARGRAVYVRNLYSGERYRVERPDIMGAVKTEHIPTWAAERAAGFAAKKEHEKSEIAR